MGSTNFLPLRARLRRRLADRALAVALALARAVPWNGEGQAAHPHQNTRHIHRLIIEKSAGAEEEDSKSSWSLEYSSYVTDFCYGEADTVDISCDELGRPGSRGTEMQRPWENEALLFSSGLSAREAKHGGRDLALHMWRLYSDRLDRGEWSFRRKEGRTSRARPGA